VTIAITQEVQLFGLFCNAADVVNTTVEYYAVTHVFTLLNKWNVVYV